MTRDVYAVLGVEPDASHADLHEAFLALANDLHPDRQRQRSIADRDQVAARMAEVTDAWRQVSTPERRHAYDLVRARAPSVPGDVPSTIRPAPRPSGRPRARPVVERGRRWSDRVLRPSVLVAGGLVLVAGVIAAAVVASGGNGGSSLTEDDVVGKCVVIGDDGLADLAPAGCGDDTPLILRRVFDPATCGGRTVPARLADDPDFLVCLVPALG